MKKLILLALSLSLFTACQFKEEVTFNKDGSGEYQLAIDMGGFMSMANGMGKKNDSLKNEKKPEVKDTVIKLADMLSEKKDSIQQLTKEERETLESLKDLMIKIHMNEPKEEMSVAYVYPFKKASDLDNILEKFKKLEKSRKGKDQMMGGMDQGMPNAKVSYEFSKKKFHRKVKVVKPAKKEEAAADNNDKMGEMMGMFQYKLVYHFPHKIKSVSYKDALLSADGKTLIIEVPMDTIIKNPKLLDFEVKF